MRSVFCVKPQIELIVSRRAIAGCVGSLIAIGAIGSLTSARAASENDVILGTGSAGPYNLVWKNIIGQTVSVAENGLTLTTVLDYKIDPANGQITFSRPLPQDSTALVQYQYDPTVSQRTVGQSTVPLKYDLSQSEHQEVYISAVGQADTLAPEPTGGNVAFTVGSLWKGSGHNQIGTKWYLDPAGSTQTPASNDSASAFAINGSADAGKGSLLSFGVNRAESALVSQDGLQPGAQTANMSLHVAPETRVVADLGYKQIDSLTPSTPSSTQSTVSLTAKPIQSTKSTAGVDVTASTSQTVQSGTQSDTSGVNVTVGNGKAIAVSTGVNVDTSGAVAHQVETVSTTLKPTPLLQVSAGYQSRTANSADTNPIDSLDTRTMQVSVKPAKTWTLTGNYNENPPDGNGNPQAMIQRGVGMTSTVGALNLNGGYNWNSLAGAPADATTLNVGLGWHVSKHGQVTGSYQQAVGASMTNNAYPWQTQYAVGYQHSLSDMLNVSLTGSFNQHPGQPIAGTSDVTGAATVGVKF